MNTLTLSSGTGLVILYILAYVASLAFHIHRNSFYNLFHFVGGFLVFVFWYGLIGNSVFSLLLTVVIGVLWEVYEQVGWKYFNRKIFPKPERADTITDLVLDFLGGLAALILTRL